MPRREQGNIAYTPIAGTPTDGMLLADMHAHVDGDTSGTPEQILNAAVRSGLTTLTVTDHDRTKSYDECRKINEKKGLGLELIRSVESTAVVEGRRGTRGKPRHVLVYDIDKAPPCYMPVGELNEWAHDQGGSTSAAHIGLGRFSLTEREILGIQDDSDPARHFDFAEIRNGGVFTLNAFAAKHPSITTALTRTGLMPKAHEIHEKIDGFLEKMKERLNLKGVTAGSDGHDPMHVGEVAIGYQPEIGLFESLKTGEMAIFQRVKLAPEYPVPFVVKTLRSWGLEFDRRRGRNGIVLYTGKPAQTETSVV